MRLGCRRRARPENEATHRVEDRDCDERELDRRADGGERRCEAATVAGEREQQRDVFARVKARRGEREERDDCANGREAPPVTSSRRVTDCEAGEGKEQAVGELTVNVGVAGWWRLTRLVGPRAGDGLTLRIAVGQSV
jgi:hypothetical protein